MKKVLCMLCAVIMLLSLMICVSATEVTEEEGLRYVFHADDFKLPYSDANICDTVVDDPDSPHGRAAKLSYEERSTTGDAGLVNSMIRVDGLSVSLQTYDGANSELVGRISLEELQANAAEGKYVTYTFKDVRLVSYQADIYMYMFDCWGLQTRFTAEQITAMMGKRLQVSVSMKIIGDVGSTTNPPTYYVDEIIISEPAPVPAHEHTFEEWNSANEYNHTSVCTFAGCGETKEAEHTWGEGVVTKEPTQDALGEETYTCIVCKATKTKRLPLLDGGAADTDTDKAGNNKGGQGMEIDPVIWIAVAMLVAAAAIVVVAVVMIKRGKKAE